MSRASLLADVNEYIGKRLIDCEDHIEKVAKRNRYSVMILDPEFNTKSIDRDTRRFNVHVDIDSVVKSFSFG